MSARAIITKINRFVALLTGLSILLAPARSVASTHFAPFEAGPIDPRFGAIETYDAPSAATEMGAGWTRILFPWAQMQPTGAHEWILSISDEELALEIAQGRQPIGLIITAPGWATDMGIGPGVPYGLHTGHNDPNNLWANFLRKLVTAYAGRIDHWIIWNEPDVWDPAHPGYTWGGSVQDFFQLQRVAYLAIKEANPSATVIFSGTSYWWDVAYGRDLFFRQYLDVLVQDLSAPGNNFYCDAVALHVYFQPDFVFSITALFHQLMREHGFDKPIWIVETNAAPSLDPQTPAPNARFAITLDEQAAYIVQAFAMGIAGGATRIGVYKTIDTSGDLVANPEPFGLVRADGSRRPAFFAYQVATTYLAGFQNGHLEQRPDVSIVTVPRVSGTTTALWTRTSAPATVQVPARTSLATLVDLWGNRRTISASGGVFTVSLPGAACTHGPPCIIGGPPYLIVEGNVDAAPPPATQPIASTPFATSEGHQDTGDEQSDQETEERLFPVPTPTPVPEYKVNLSPFEVKEALDVWRKRALPGYQIELVSGPPSHLYRLTVVDEAVTGAQRSSKPLTRDLSDLDTRKGQAAFTYTMTTLYDRRSLIPYTVAGLFDRVTNYFGDRPSSPACDTYVAVNLNPDWGFPNRIVERWAADCQADGEPYWVTVVDFSTLTPSPTPWVNAPTPTETASPTASPTPRATPTSTRTATPSVSPISPTSRTAQSADPTSGSENPLWIVLLAGVVIAGTLLIRRNNKGARY